MYKKFRSIKYKGAKMINFTEETKIKFEDQIMSIAQGIYEIEGCCNVISSAATNEFDPPKIQDIENSVAILKEYVLKIKEKTKNHIKYCENLGILNN